MAKKFDKSVFIGKFKEETGEHVARLEKDLLYLENNPRDTKLIEDMMREAHTLKGSATMMGYKRIADLAHKFEDALLQIKNGKISPGDAHFEILLKIVDTINPLLEDKVTWVDKGIAYPYVVNLEDEVNKLFGITGKPAPPAKAGKKKKAAEEEAPPLKIEIAKKVPEERAPAVRIAEPEERTESVRVEVGKLNQLMNIVGELVIEKIRVDQHRSDLDDFSSKVEELNFRLSQPREREISYALALNVKKEFDAIIDKFARTADEMGFVINRLQDGVMSVRMLPLEVIFRIFPRAVRDLSKSENKSIEFNVSGEETELDKSVVEKIQDPLMHILRNAVAHGIEPPRERKANNKNEMGRIDLRAYYKGSQAVIEIEDDGKGIDPNEIRKAAVRKGILSKEEAKEIADSQVLNLLLTPDFSTDKGVSQASGRGVGLDVVRNNVVQLKGLIDISSTPGKGTKFTIKLPLTLAVTHALFVVAHGERLAIPLDNVEQILRVTAEDVKKVEKREAISIGDEIVPLIRLGEVLGLRSPKNRERKEHAPVVLTAAAEKKLAVLTDELLGKFEVVIKSLGSHLKNVPYIAGATTLGTGEVALVLDIPSLIFKASSLPQAARPFEPAKEKEAAKHTILVTEDSLITRELEKSILEAAGYKVRLARDGAEALKKLSDEKVDLVIADVAMPTMDGIALVKNIRKDKRLSKIPVIIVSAKKSPEDKKQGLEAGANAYFAKSAFDQAKLLDTIERLIG